MPPESELFLFLADRANHVQTIVRPAIRAGKVVLCDRFADSTLVYQCRARELDEEFVRSANLFATGELTPDVTFLLDLPVEVGLARVTDLNRLDKEPVNFHEKVRQGFLAEAAAEPGRWVVIDAQQAAEDVANRIIGELLARLG
jgi:dTMP kinase